MLINFANQNDVAKDVVSGDLSKVIDYNKSQINKGGKAEANFVAGAIDTASLNPIWRERFTRSFNSVMGSNVTFDAISDEEKEVMKSFTITGGVSGTSIADVFETTVLPVADALLYDNSAILSRVSRINVGLNDGNQSFDLNEFGAESDAENLDEDDAGTEADDSIRNGDTITPKNKIQASTSFTEYALLTMQPELLAQYMARGMKRLQNRMVYNILAGSNASNQFKGIINSAGSTEDDQEGALAFAVGSATDNLDYMLRMIGNLPNTVTEGEESGFVYIGRRSDFYSKLAIVQNASNDYKRVDVISSIPGERSIGGFPFLFAGTGLSANQVILADLANYYVAQKGGMRMVSDEGLATVKTGVVTVAFRVYADGGMVLAHKNAVGSGAGASDNTARNLFRLATLS